MLNQRSHRIVSTTLLNRVSLAIMMLLVSPLVLADWKSSLQSYARDVQVGLYAVTAVIALVTLTWVGVKWLISRSNGDHETTLMDYFRQIGSVALVGGVILIGTAAWQFFGGTGL